MNNYIVIGDLHGNTDTFKQIVSICEDKGLGLVCIGDYTDSHTYSKKEQLSLLEEMIGVYNRWEQKPIYLIGNHDLHYISARFNDFQCTGWTRSKWELFNPAYLKMLREGMLRFHWADLDMDVLYTHAGLEKILMLELLNKEFEQFADIAVEEVDNKLLKMTRDMWDYLLSNGLYNNNNNNNNNVLKPLFDYGSHSGGLMEGGIFWLRPQEMVRNLNKNEYYPFKQVVGHTKIEHIYFDQFETMTYFIDTLDPEWSRKQQYLLIENKTISIKDLN